MQRVKLVKLLDYLLKNKNTKVRELSSANKCNIQTW